MLRSLSSVIAFLFAVSTIHDNARGNRGSLVKVVGGGGSGGAFAGNGGRAVRAKLSSPRHIAFDTTGNLYIADNVFGANPNRSRCEIRVVTRRDGRIRVVAGQGLRSARATPAARMQMRSCGGLAVDALGNVLFQTASTSRMYGVAVRTGRVTAYGTGGGAISTDRSGDILFVRGDQVLMITRVGTIVDVAGTGATGYLGDGHLAVSARLNDPSGIATDSRNDVFIADRGNHRVREVVASTRVIETVAGGGSCRPGSLPYCGLGGDPTRANIVAPQCVAVDTKGDLYIAAGVVLELRKGDRRLSRIAGNGQVPVDAQEIKQQRTTQPALSARTNAVGVAVDSRGGVYFVEDNVGLVREIVQP